MVFNQKVKYKTNEERLTRVFAALADPTRRAILAQLGSGDAPVAELVTPHAMSAPAISKHLKVLEEAGLISRTRKAQQRPCHLEAEALREATDWLERYRALWEGRLEALDDYLKALQSTNK